MKNLYIYQIEVKGQVYFKFGYSTDIDKLIKAHKTHYSQIELTSTHYHKGGFEFEQAVHSLVEPALEGGYYYLKEINMIYKYIYSIEAFREDFGEDFGEGIASMAQDALYCYCKARDVKDRASIIYFESKGYYQYSSDFKNYYDFVGHERIEQLNYNRDKIEEVMHDIWINQQQTD